MALKVYIIRRSLQLLPLIFGVVALNFIIIQIAPGDPILYLIGGEPVSEAYIEELRSRYGLDQTILEQLVKYFANVLKGDLGYSFRLKRSVGTIVLERMPATVLLMGTGFVIALGLGLVLGVVASKKQHSFKDNLITSVSLFGYSMPVFWLALMLLILFAIRLNWLPAQGMTSVREEYTGLAHIIDIIRHLILPAMVVGIYYMAIYTRLVRASMLEILRRDFILTAWSKGLGDQEVYYGHALRNALLPVVTIAGLNLGVMLSGAVLTETVFAWPGLGRLMFESILSRDYPVLSGIFFFTSSIVVVINLLTDVLYAFIDPRIRYK